MSWSYRITILILAFVCMMTGLVVAAFHQDFDLVTEDYYGKELQFQSLIEKQKNQQHLSMPIVCSQTDQQFIIQFPQELMSNKLEGEIFLFRPSNAKKDVKMKLKLVSGKQLINKRELSQGWYKIQITYDYEG